MWALEVYFGAPWDYVINLAEVVCSIPLSVSR
jgi:hypothetical protein